MTSVSCMGKADTLPFSLPFLGIPVRPHSHRTASLSATRWSSTTWPQGAYNTRARRCEEGARLFAEVGIPQFVPCADVFGQSSRSATSTIFPLRSARDVSHVVRENQRTLDAARLLTEGDLAQVGTLMCESHTACGISTSKLQGTRHHGYAAEGLAGFRPADE